MAETVEETFESEVTRKTVRTSYKIEEVSTQLFLMLKCYFIFILNLKYLLTTTYIWKMKITFFISIKKNSFFIIRFNSIQSQASICNLCNRYWKLFQDIDYMVSYSTNKILFLFRKVVRFYLYYDIVVCTFNFLDKFSFWWKFTQKKKKKEKKLFSRNLKL